MEERHDHTEQRRFRGVDPRRRRVLTALGAACVPAVAGCTTDAPRSTDDTPTTSPTMQQGTQGVDPRFGYVGTSDDQPPVEPDHTVQLLIQPRDDAWLPEFYFEPTGLCVDVGDTVRFDLATPHHNVNAYHPAFGYRQRVPDQVPPFSSPILTGGDYWLYTFEREGVHDVACAPHELFGMVGRIVVGSATGPGASPVGEAPGGERSRPPEFTAGLVLSDPAMDPETIVERTTVAWSDLEDESKQPRLRPIEE